MRKAVSHIYSKAFPKKGGGEYTSKELVVRFIVWTIFFALLFFLMKFFYERFYWDYQNMHQNHRPE